MLVQQTAPLPGGFIVNQPLYLTNNWRAFQAENDREYTKYLKVQGGTVTILNGLALLRCPLSGVPDGFYRFNDEGLLVPAPQIGAQLSSQDGYFMRYPDIDVLRPVFSHLECTPAISNAEVRTMVDFLSHVRSSDEYGYASVLFEDDALIDAGSGGAWMQLSCHIPVKHGHGYFRTNTLRLILIDMLRYESIFIGADSSPMADIDSPLVIGLDWPNCGLIRPRR